MKRSRLRSCCVITLSILCSREAAAQTSGPRTILACRWENTSRPSLYRITRQHWYTWNEGNRTWEELPCSSASFALHPPQCRVHASGNEYRWSMSGRIEESGARPFTVDKQFIVNRITGAAQYSYSMGTEGSPLRDQVNSSGVCRRSADPARLRR